MQTERELHKLGHSLEQAVFSYKSCQLYDGRQKLSPTLLKLSLSFTHNKVTEQMNLMLQDSYSYFAFE